MLEAEHFMRLALAEARSALACHEFPVGCVLVQRERVVASGRRQHSRAEGSAAAVNELDHAEIVALRELVASQPQLDRGEITLYSTLEPCLMCFSTLILNGIHRIVYAYEDAMGGGSNLPLATLAPLYREMAVSVTPHLLRQESLELFQEFFHDPHHDYWRGSLLESYTLAQKAEMSPRPPRHSPKILK